MSDVPAAEPPGSPPDPELKRDPTIWGPEVERLDEAECWRLIGAGGVGRLAYSGRHGVAVLPVRYKLDQGSIVFRTPLDSPTDEDLRTGIEGAEYRVSFEIDEVGQYAQEGWMVFIQGDAHHMDSEDDRASAWAPGGLPSGSDPREHFLRITPTVMAGRRLRRP
jgi:nitroimidazol reductase NimA-like FMN-containing flavoprotein (pyridoxamine 5'-phosphate oxidase superfamily)